MATAQALWSVRRRPSALFLAWSAIPAVAVGAIAWWLIPLLMIEPSPWPGTVAGAVLTGVFIATIAQGAGVRVDADGHMVYRLHGADLWRVHLSRVDALTVVRTGILTGIGVMCDPQAIEALSRKGPPRSELLRLRQKYGIGAVIEHLHAEDMHALEDLRRRFALAPPAPPARSSPA